MKGCLKVLAAILMLTLGSSRTVSRAADREKAASAYREGNGLIDQNRFSAAAAAYNLAIGEYPQYAEAYHNRALANEMVDRKTAIQD
jgi:threonine aldolase